MSNHRTCETTRRMGTIRAAISIAVVAWLVGCGEVHSDDPDASPDAEAMADAAPPMGTPDGNEPPPPTACGVRLLYVDTGPAGKTDVYTATRDGRVTFNVTSHPASDIAASWSPDGKRILFSSDREGARYDVFVVAADGTGLANLSKSADADDLAASWSPDGKRVAYVGGGALWVAAADGTGRPTQLVPSMVDRLTVPAWSPDGGTLLYGTLAKERTDLGKADLATVPSNGGTIRSVTATINDDEIEASWSPDGARIAYVVRGDVLVSNADGSGATVLTPDTRLWKERAPVWAGASEILFSSTRESGAFKVFRVSTSGGSPTRVSDHALSSTGDGATLGDIVTGLSPDGKAIAFRRFVPGDLVGGSVAATLVIGAAEPVLFGSKFAEGPLWPACTP